MSVPLIFALFNLTFVVDSIIQVGNIWDLSGKIKSLDIVLPTCTTTNRRYETERSIIEIMAAL